MERVTFKGELIRKGGDKWIANIQTAPSDKPLKLYATGECTMAAGRIYVALPEFPTPEQRALYKLM